MPNAETVLCGIVLHPAGHTRSPAMHNAAYAALGLDAAYLSFDVPPALLEEAIEGVRRHRVRQLSVSIPHKTEVLSWVDDVDETATAIGAANTLVLDGEHLRASNTDWLGVVRALEPVRTLEGARAVVLGAGGTARAATYGLRARGASVRLLNRTVAKAEALARELGADGAGALDELGDAPCDVVVNTTSVGLGEDRSPVRVEAIPRACVVLDAVYAPERTRLLQDAATRGAQTVSGRWMLVHQAVAQLEAWHGPVDADRIANVMSAAFGPEPDVSGHAGAG
ncbi:MAG: shikimate dehydrogenase [Myxococcota bacterium]